MNMGNIKTQYNQLITYRFPQIFLGKSRVLIVVFTFWKSFWSCMFTELMNSLSYGFSIEALSERYEMDSLSFVHEGQSLTIRNLTPNGGGIWPFQCEQTHFQGTFEVHRQMAHKWKVWVLFLQNEMDQTFQDLGKIAVTSVKVDHSKQPSNLLEW